MQPRSRSEEAGNEEEPGEETVGATGRGEGSSAGETTWQELSKDQTIAVQMRMRSLNRAALPFPGRLRATFAASNVEPSTGKLSAHAGVSAQLRLYHNNQDEIDFLFTPARKARGVCS